MKQNEIEDDRDSGERMSERGKTARMELPTNNTTKNHLRLLNKMKIITQF